MIVLDTHVWVWWANQSEQLGKSHRETISQHASDGLGVSVISCWEVCKLVEKRRLQLAIALGRWIESAVSLPGIVILPLTPQIAVESVQLSPPLNGAPADQIIVATARVYRASLLTADQRLIDHPGVPTL